MIGRPENIDRFREECYGIYTSYCFSIRGIRLEAKALAKGSKGNRNRSDKTLYIGRGHPGENPHIAEIKVSEVIKKSKENGYFEDTLSKQTLFYIYTIWDVKYRKLIAEELSVDINKIRCDLLGDVRHLRNKLSHTQSILEQKDVDKLIVLTEHFKAGEFKLNSNFMSYFMETLNSCAIYLHDEE